MKLKKRIFFMIAVFTIVCIMLSSNVMAKSTKKSSSKKTTYSISYVLNGGKNSKSNPKSYSTKKTLKLKKPTKKGYTFKGWYTSSKYKTKVTTIKKGSKGKKTLYAKWAKTKYKITYKLNGGKNSKSNPSNYTISTSTITLKKPTRSGYTFCGWYTSSKYKTKVTTIKKGSTGNKTLYAKWKKNSTKTTSKQKAIDKAKSYLKILPFSYQGLVDQLKYEKFSSSDAKYGADHCGANWNEQAVKCAKNYLKNIPFSYESLKGQLEYEKFTSSQAKYGVDHCGANWNEQAVKCAKDYLKNIPFSYEGLKEQLEYEEFTSSQAKYGVDHCGANWKEQAVKCAKEYLEYFDYTKEELIDQLLYEEFTQEEAEYAALQCNL